MAGNEVILGINSSSLVPEVITSTTNSLNVNPDLIAGERNPSSATNSYLVTQREWNYTVYNPRAASTGSTLGAAGTVGATEVLITNAACLVGPIFFQADSTASKGLILRDTNATGNSIAGIYISPTSAAVPTTNAPFGMDGFKFLTGLTVCGESLATGVSAVICWKPA